VEFAKYERLLKGLPLMQTKHQAILLWTYTRDPEVLDSEEGKKFVHLVLDSLLLYQGQSFKIDNFDLTLIV
jgi:hypothetical protein